MHTQRAACTRTTVACGLVVLGVASGLGAQGPPAYTVDPFWPKPLPNTWIMQQVPTLVVDKDDHVWVFNRSRQIRPDENGASTTPPRTDCCIAGPSVLEFDTDGNLLHAWGGPGYVPNWPREQTIAVDGDGNVLVSGTQRGDSILKFSREGKWLWDFGRRPPSVPAGQTPPPLQENNQQTDMLISGVAGFDFDADARELNVADTEFLNKRILVFDMDTGAFKRGWGGKGKPLSQIGHDRVPPYDTSGPPPDIDDFVVLHCLHISRDGLVYVSRTSPSLLANSVDVMDTGIIRLCRSTDNDRRLPRALDRGHDRLPAGGIRARSRDAHASRGVPGDRWRTPSTEHSERWRPHRDSNPGFSLERAAS